jgi:hypothetical protein
MITKTPYTKPPTLVLSFTVVRASSSSLSAIQEFPELPQSEIGEAGILGEAIIEGQADEIAYVAGLMSVYLISKQVFPDTDDNTCSTDAHLINKLLHEYSADKQMRIISGARRMAIKQYSQHSRAYRAVAESLLARNTLTYADVAKICEKFRGVKEE